MKNKVIKRFVILAIVCVLVTVFAAPAFAASYSKMYGQTQTKVRVRSDASTNATIIDNIVKGACVYATTSKTSGGNTFIKVQYRAADGDIMTGWVCQSDGSETYVKMLSASQAEDKFSVKSGNLPNKRVGTFTDAQRKASADSSDSTYVREGSSGTTVRDVQTKLKALGYYNGEITGHVGSKTEAAIKEFQKDYGLTADGIAGPQTLAKIDAVYDGSGKTAGASGGSGLRLGSTGTAVRDLQQDLTTLGFYWAEVTGNFGSKTETAVKRFQEEHGLTADGVAGPKTLAAIETAVEKKGGVAASGSTSGTALKLDSQGDKVAQMQRDLKQLGYYYADVTGNFGPKTEAAVKAFQKAHGLTADGVAGPKTLAAIDAEIKEAGGSTASGSTGGLRLGSTGDSVTALQQNLTTLGYYYGDITGHYGSMTQTAVKKFQSKHGLTADGVAGAKTVEAIENAVKNSGSKPAGSATTSSTLREGDSGAGVTELQTMLKALGYYYGDITGHFGTLTRNAVKAFQDKNGLTVDGVAGPATLNKLRSMTGGSSSNSNSDGAGSTVSTADSYGKLVKDNVYLRSSYSTSSASKASLSKGTKLRITKTVTSGGMNWYYVTVNVGKYTYKGYIRADMIEIITAAEYGSGSDNSAGGLETIGMIRVTGNNVALRYEPSTSATKVGTANMGDVFYYVDTVSGWYQTKAGYWISSTYAKPMTDAEVDSYVGIDTNKTYRYDDTSSTVGWIQQVLKGMGLYKAEVTNHFGSKTEAAVKAFQTKYGLPADGVVGPTTMAKLIEVSSSGSSASTAIGKTVYNMDWFGVKNAGNLPKYGFASGKTAILTDLTTMKSFNIHIQSTGNHADVEPLTLADTKTMCAIYGVSDPSQIGWQARPMMVTIVGSDGKTTRQIVCSIYGEEHGSEDIKDNGYDGQFCLHFTGSKTHTGAGVLDRHVAAIADAVTKVKANGATVKSLTK